MIFLLIFFRITWQLTTIPLKYFAEGGLAMKIIKVIGLQCNTYNNIKDSMDVTKGISAANNLDACGCTGNGLC